MLVCLILSLLFRTAKLGISFGIVAVIIVLILFVCFAEKCMVSLLKKCFLFSKVDGCNSATWSIFWGNELSC